MSNFFNAIGVADMEKVHSAMIAWILNDENDPVHSNGAKGNSNFTTFPIKERSEILCKMFSQDIRYFDTIRTHVEWNDIDIMIETTGANGNEIWIIENKLKTPEHKSKVDAAEMKKWDVGNLIWQTQKYEYVINDYIRTLDDTISQTHYLLLSLGGDKAQSPSAPSLWHELKYEGFHKILSNYPMSHSNAAMIHEYINSVGEVVTELGNFIANPTTYPNVFKKMKKAEKEALLISGKSINQNERYILENGLETIFQKQFLIKMVEWAGLSSLNIVIDEDNGIAEFDYTLARFNNTVKCENGDLLLQVQFQDGTFKVVIIHSQYRNCNPNDYKQIYGDFKNGQWDGQWYKMFKEAENKKEGWTLYKAKNLNNNQKKTKPRIALDKKMNGVAWYNNIEEFKKAFEEAKIFAKTFDRP